MHPLVLPVLFIFINIILCIYTFAAATQYNNVASAGPVDLTNIVTNTPAFQACAYHFVGSILIYVFMYVPHLLLPILFVFHLFSRKTINRDYIPPDEELVARVESAKRKRQQKEKEKGKKR